MLNIIWAVMIMIGIVFAAFTGQIGAVTNAAIESAKEAIALCITMAGVMALWMGLMEIAGKAGLVAKMTKGINPFLKFLFPRIPDGHPAKGYIATNIIANVLGLGWAATPAGLKAMKELTNLEDERAAAIKHVPRKNYNHKMEDKAEDRTEDKKVRRKFGAGIASDEMCTFLIINISSLQLIPVNIIVYRSQYGSVNPTAIIGPGLIATVFSTMAAIIFCKIMTKKS